MVTQEEVKYVFRSEDLTSVSVFISIQNQSSRTTFGSSNDLKKSSTHGVRGDEDSIQLLELQGNMIAISVPRSSCAKGHSLRIKMSVKNLESPLEIELQGTVLEMEMTSETDDRIEILISNTREPNWIKFCSFFQEKQKNVDDLLRNMRGY